MFSGEFSVTLDDTCRISLPRCLRDGLETGKVYLTQGKEGSLWLFTIERWKKLVETVVISTNPLSEDTAVNPFFAEGRHYSRRFIGTSHLVDIDKQGRILVPPSLRDFAGLCKDCVVLGLYDYIEIWAEDRYQGYLKASEGEYEAASRDLGARIMKEKELGNYGNSSRPGTAGTGYSVSRPEGQG